MKGKQHFKFVWFKSLEIIRFILLLIVCIGISQSSFAQEPLMAKGNKVLTVSYGMSNIYKSLLTLELNNNEFDDESYSYTAKFTNPLIVSFDYAISDYTTIGLSGGFYSFRLKERREYPGDTIEVDTKGLKFAIQLRGIRYIVQSPRSVFYMFAGAGVRLRSMKHNTSDTYIIRASRIHQTPETNPTNYSPLSLDAGMGLKFLVTKKIGISCEFGMMTGLAQVGMFYSLKNKWRRVNDKIGW